MINAARPEVGPYLAEIEGGPVTIVSAVSFRHSNWMSEPISLLVMVAGMGSRYGGLKQIDPVGPSGEVLLDYAVYDARQAGIGRVVFLIRKDLEADFRRAIGKRYEGKLEVDYAFQELHDLPKGFAVPEGRKKPWGTGSPVSAERSARKTAAVMRVISPGFWTTFVSVLVS